jgi:hypothetical protein
MPVDSLEVRTEHSNIGGKMSQLAVTRELQEIRRKECGGSVGAGSRKAEGRVGHGVTVGFVG